MAKKTYVKISGVWKPIVNIWTKVSGIWQEEVMSWIRVSSIWKQCMTYAPPAPATLNLDQSGFGDPIDADWTESSGATGYELERKPYYSGGNWINNYLEIYDGANTDFEDNIQTDPIEDGTEVFYRVRAYNGSGQSDWKENSIIWYGM